MEYRSAPISRVNDRYSQEERLIINRNQTCNSDAIIDALPNISHEKINHLLTNYAYHPAVMDFMRCYITALARQDTKASDASKIKLMAELSPGKVISDSTVEGITLLSQHDDVVIKVPKGQTQERLRSLIHEVFIGYFLNDLRSLNSNFMYSYGYFSCNRPSKHGDKYYFCREIGPAGDTVYAAFEKIKGVSLYSFLQDANTTQEDVVAIFWQLFLSLYAAWLKGKYTHNDLHYLNVMIETTNYQAQRIQVGDRYHYVKTRYRAVVIDYGYNCITINGVVYGSEHPRFGVFKNLYVFSNDVTRLLSQSITTFVSSSSQLKIDRPYDKLILWFQCISYLFSGKSSEEMEQIIAGFNQRHGYAFFSDNQEEITRFRQALALPIEARKYASTDTYTLVALTFDYNEMYANLLQILPKLIIVPNDFFYEKVSVNPNSRGLTVYACDRSKQECSASFQDILKYVEKLNPSIDIYAITYSYENAKDEKTRQEILEKFKNNAEAMLNAFENRLSSDNPFISLNELILLNRMGIYAEPENTVWPDRVSKAWQKFNDKYN